ncbi:MAG: hypothetical protein E6R04_03035 [Spirochaetes bacterium]|nr:MAG: hypothetical protein E6R04_03035 [Spirochaetota bacterium]
MGDYTSASAISRMVRKVSSVPFQVHTTSEGNIKVTFEGTPASYYSSFDTARKMLTNKGYYVIGTAGGLIVDGSKKWKQ